MRQPEAKERKGQWKSYTRHCILIQIGFEGGDTEEEIKGMQKQFFFGSMRSFLN